MQFVTSVRLLESFENTLACSLQPRHVLLDRPLDLIKIDAQIRMNEHIAETRQGHPVDIGAPAFGAGAESLCGLGHRLKISKHCILHNVQSKSLRAPRDVLLDSRDAAENVTEIGLGRPSQRDRFLQNTIPQELIQTALGHDLHGPTEQGLQLRHEPSRKPRARARPDVYQQVDIARRPGIATGH